MFSHGTQHVGQNVPRIEFNEVAELSRCLLPRIGSLDAFNTLLGDPERRSRKEEIQKEEIQKEEIQTPWAAEK